MPDNAQNWGKPDSARINVNHPHELNYWTKELRVDERTLRDALRQAGPSLLAVRRHLRSNDAED